jgi:deoxyribodipyrimidine photo-lyase
MKAPRKTAPAARIGPVSTRESTGMRSLVWLRSDLRARDNSALHAAAATSGRGAIAVFLLSPEQWLEHDWAPVKVDLILRTLRELSASLEPRGIPLLVRSAPRFADAPAVLLAIAGEHACDALHFNLEYELNETRRDEAVAAAFSASGRAVRTHHDQTLLVPGQVRTGEGRPYTVYTPFRRACEARLAENGLPPALGLPRKQPELATMPDPVPQSIPGFNGLARPDLWPAGEYVPARRLAAFVGGGLRRYHLDRDRPDLNGTSTLSPWLSCGSISIRQCLQAAAEANNGGITPPKSGQPNGPSTWIGELLWREFYKHLLIAFPRLSMNLPFKRATDAIPWRSDSSALDAWKQGRTGYPIVDAGMRQLAQTGWMHNRLRMITAMFLTKDLLIDWREGERHFMRSLVDGDLAQNNGGWQWSASTGTDAVPYFRIFNPASQSKKFDPEGAYIRRFIPELASIDGPLIHEPHKLPPLTRSRLDYPAPIVDHAHARTRTLAAFSNL